MSEGSTKDYDFSQKNHWRRTLWNEVLRRTGGREKSELLLYLAGPDDLDREVAVAKRVPSLNLIAIDKKRATVRSIRDDGNAAICGDVVDVLTTWPKASPVCAVVLDFCQGFQKLDDLRRLVKLTGAHPALKRAVLAVNMQRGRDAETNDQRVSIGHYIRRQMPGVDPKHRGMIFALWYILNYFTSCEALVSLMSTGTAEQQIAVWQTLFKLFEPKAYTYRSGVLCFDSVVITSGGELFDEDPQHNKWSTSISQHGVRAVALSTAATLAVRTRRLRERHMTRAESLH